MSLCITISKLASEVEQQLSSLCSSHLEMLSVMKRMPEYLERGNLSGWEVQYRNAIHPKEDELSHNYKAIDLIYELASLNLFGKFEATKTKELYRNVASQLSEKGINVSKNLEVNQW